MANMTREEIEERIRNSKIKALEQTAEREAAKAEKSRVVQQIIRAGYRLRYVDREVAFAYNETDAYFTVKSHKDQFSRPDARRSLLRHIERGSHRFPVSLPDGGGQTRPDEGDTVTALAAGLLEKTISSPQEVPSRYAKKLRRRVMKAFAYPGSKE